MKGPEEHREGGDAAASKDTQENGQEGHGGRSLSLALVHLVLVNMYQGTRYSSGIPKVSNTQVSMIGLIGGKVERDCGGRRTVR